MHILTSKIGIILLSYCITLLTLPLILVPFTLLFLFKEFVKIYLKIKYGKSFGGMIDSADSYFLIGEAHRNVTDIVLVVNDDPNNPGNLAQEIKKLIKNNIIENAQKVPKLSSTVHSNCGFGYLLRKDVDYDECITTIRVTNDSVNYSKTVQEVLGEFTRNKLPYDNTLLWQVVVVTGSTEWKLKQNIKENHVYVLIRLHHIFADGISTAKSFAGMYFQEERNFTENIKNVIKSIIKKRNFFMKLVENIHVCLMAPGFLLLHRFKKLDASVTYLETGGIDGNRMFFVNVDIDGSIMKSIKRIKKAIGDTAFLEVVLTALSASFEKYFTNNIPTVPDIATTAIPVIMNVKKAKSNKLELKNTYGFFLLPLPILVRSSSLLDRLKEVKNRTRLLAEAPDSKAQYVFLNYVLGLIPVNLIENVINTENISMCFSNFPGFPKVYGFNGLEIENIFFFPPTRGKTGVASSLITYDDRVHIGLAVNDKFMPNKEHCQRIVDDVFQNIRLFDEQVLIDMAPEQVITVKL